MSREIKLWQDPYGEGNLFKKKSVTFEPGLTVLVGCNGIGKTTMLHNIKSCLRKEKIPCIEFDNCTDGGHFGRERAGIEEDYVFLATAAFSSEGENIVMNLGKLASRLRKFIATGDNGDKSAEFIRIITGEEKEEITSNERWILLDAIDSGLSVDNICDVKEYLFNTILTDPENQDKDIYIIASANEYELANGENCLDVLNGLFTEFISYEDYKRFILATKKEKEKRWSDEETENDSEG